MTPEELAQREQHDRDVAEHYRVLAQIRMVKEEYQALHDNAARIQHDLDQAQHAEEWLRWRDGLDTGALAPWSIDDKSWVEACGGQLMLQSPVIMRPGAPEAAMAKPMKAEHICLFPELYVKKPELHLTIRMAQYLRAPGPDERYPAAYYCVCEIPGKRESRFSTRAQKMVEDMSSGKITEERKVQWDHTEAKVPKFEVGNTLHFSVFRALPPELWQPGQTAVLNCPHDKHFNGQTVTIQSTDARNCTVRMPHQRQDAQIPLEQVVPVPQDNEDFLGSCTIASKKFIPRGFDGLIQLQHTGLPQGQQASLSIHIDPSAVGAILEGETRNLRG
jgi:hypothetical protein